MTQCKHGRRMRTMPSIEGPELEALYVHAVRAGWTVERCKRDKGAMDLMTTLVVVVAVICAGAVVTFIGARLIERAHRPRGRFIDVGGFRQHVIELGHAADPKNLPVVLLHGAAANLQDMNFALGVTRVILIDRPGFGYGNRETQEGKSPAYQSSVLRVVLNQLGVDRAIIVGHSWGGTLALIFALDHPERVAGLVLVAAPTLSAHAVHDAAKKDFRYSFGDGYLLTRWRCRSARS